jgi:hypothetical protein
MLYNIRMMTVRCSPLPNRNPGIVSVNSLSVAAKAENDLQRRDALLVELRQLQQAWPQDAAVRQQLAMTLDP